MRPIKKVLSIAEDDGFYIGKPVQAYIDQRTFKMKGFLCQLFGIPARLIFHEIDSDIIHIDQFTIYFKSTKNLILLKFFEEKPFIKANKLTPLRGMAAFSEDEGFIGYIEDFDIASPSLRIEGFTIFDENWKFNREPYLKETSTGYALVFKDLYHGVEKTDYSFFKKRIILEARKGSHAF